MNGNGIKTPSKLEKIIASGQFAVTSVRATAR